MDVPELYLSSGLPSRRPLDEFPGGKLARSPFGAFLFVPNGRSGPHLDLTKMDPPNKKKVSSKSIMKLVLLWPSGPQMVVRPLHPAPIDIVSGIMYPKMRPTVHCIGLLKVLLCLAFASTLLLCILHCDGIGRSSLVLLLLYASKHLVHISS